MITKLYITNVVVYVQVYLKLPVVFAEIQLPKLEKNQIHIMHIFGSAFGFGVYMKPVFMPAVYFGLDFIMEPNTMNPD